MTLSLQEGRAAVSLARAALDEHVGGTSLSAHQPLSAVFSEERGVFVTLNQASGSGERLRGCIGFPYPVKKLREAIEEAAVAAATEDPRFPPVGPAELDSIVVEVSVLTVPKDIEAPRAELPSRVKIGEDGLIVSRAYLSGLLLPQVATEFGLGREDFLSQTCLKAGLPPDAWLDKETRVQSFQAEIFSEKRPRGEVVRGTGGER